MVITVKTHFRQIITSNLYRALYLTSVVSVVSVLSGSETTTDFGRAMAWVGAALLLAHTYTVKFAVKEPEPVKPRVSPEEVARQGARLREMLRLAEQEHAASSVIDAEFVAASPTVRTTTNVRRVTVRVVDRSR